ncbi:uncharacterized protein C8Q71DRAFT_726832 [Rhodofomes roseus]|uniref:Uncharacterized protein n=2 Tax=Rhodofomes roseus TaxID=34475 RepID=A0ABQ8K482_9APHY|nr:uncharacterized protein C8Q71DRAFT_726832 [Rhodofomes roseus]KAH9831681.1 hypothetical protein C8Q71DRAFT_726832 [Rhodofomes roseus]
MSAPSQVPFSAPERLVDPVFLRLQAVARDLDQLQAGVAEAVTFQPVLVVPLTPNVAALWLRWARNLLSAFWTFEVNMTLGTCNGYPSTALGRDLRQAVFDTVYVLRRLSETENFGWAARDLLDPSRYGAYATDHPAAWAVGHTLIPLLRSIRLPADPDAPPIELPYGIRAEYAFGAWDDAEDPNAAEPEEAQDPPRAAGSSPARIVEDDPPRPASAVSYFDGDVEMRAASPGAGDVPLPLDSPGEAEGAEPRPVSPAFLDPPPAAPAPAVPARPFPSSSSRRRSPSPPIVRMRSPSPPTPSRSLTVERWGEPTLLRQHPAARRVVRTMEQDRAAFGSFGRYAEQRGGEHPSAPPPPPRRDSQSPSYIPLGRNLRLIGPRPPTTEPPAPPTPSSAPPSSASTVRRRGPPARLSASGERISTARLAPSSAPKPEPIDPAPPVPSSDTGKKRSRYALFVWSPIRPCGPCAKVAGTVCRHDGHIGHSCARCTHEHYKCDLNNRGPGQMPLKYIGPHRTQTNADAKKCNHQFFPSERIEGPHPTDLLAQFPDVSASAMSGRAATSSAPPTQASTSAAPPPPPGPSSASSPPAPAPPQPPRATQSAPLFDPSPSPSPPPAGRPSIATRARALQAQAEEARARVDQAQPRRNPPRTSAVAPSPATRRSMARRRQASPPRIDVESEDSDDGSVYEGSTAEEDDELEDEV